jgi:response regulator RpfG family c-di-GMP phosphodiesterase
MEAAISAVNEGNIFRFLTKPCPTSLLVKSLMACASQYLLQTSERVLLEQTLHGSIKALTDILALANPAAFGRATRVQQSVAELMEHYNVGQRWPAEVAAMLSQIGYVILPPQTQEKLYAGEDLTSTELRMVARVPEIVEELFANIPRLELVREMLRLHTKHFAEGRPAGVTTMRAEIPWGARALKIAVDYDILKSANIAADDILIVMRRRTGWYDPGILEAFAEL